MRAQAIRGPLSPRPAAILLDAFGTLVSLEPPGPRLRAELAARAGVEVSGERAASAFAAEIAFYLGHHLEGRDPRSLDLLRDRCAEVLADGLGLPPGPDVRAAMLAALRFHAFPDAAPALRTLRAAGLRLVVVSNWDASLPEVLRGAGLLELVDAVVASAAVGAAKPDRRVFEAALEAARVAPARALLVGDSPVNDVAGARAAGVDALLLRRGAEGPQGADELRSLEELPSLIFGQP